MNISAAGVSNVMSVDSVVDSTPRRANSSSVQMSGREAAVSDEEMKKMVEEMQNQVNRTNVSLTFTTYGQHGDEIAVVVASRETGEVIREIPSKEIQDLYARMSELAGRIFNRQA